MLCGIGGTRGRAALLAWLKPEAGVRFPPRAPTLANVRHAGGRAGHGRPVVVGWLRRPTSASAGLRSALGAPWPSGAMSAPAAGAPREYERGDFRRCVRGADADSGSGLRRAVARARGERRLRSRVRPAWCDGAALRRWGRGRIALCSMTRRSAVYGRARAGGRRVGARLDFEVAARGVLLIRVPVILRAVCWHRRAARF